MDVHRQPAPDAAPDAAAVPTTADFAIRTILDFWRSRAVWLAAHLRLADAVADEGTTLDELARRTGTHAPTLARLLEALVREGVFRRAADGRVEHTAISAGLRTGAPGSPHALLDVLLGGEHYEAWAAIGASLRTGRTAFEVRHGTSWIGYYERDPAAGRRFAEAMTASTHAFEEVVLAAHRFADFELAVDVGGSEGSLVRRLLRLHPGARGIVFDLPAVAAAAPASWAGSAEADRIKAVGGNFFEAVPEGGDLYLLKFVLHDWDDDRALAILRSVRRAVRSGGRVAIIESLLPDGDQAHPGRLMDLNMLAMTGGRERTVGQYRALLEAAGFRVERVTPTPAPIGVIEAVG